MTLRFIALLALMICGLIQATAAQAHLLNMSEAQLYIKQTGELEIHLRLDLLAETGSTDAYFQLNQFAADNDFAKIKSQYPDLTQRLEAAIEITESGRTLGVRLSDVTPAESATRADFDSDYVWPKMKLTLEAELMTTEAIRVRFLPGFRFEEPIALSMIELDEHARVLQKKSRWLVSGQSGPVMALSRSLPSASGEPFAKERITPTDWRTAASFVTTGFTHILPKGWDHLLFLLILLLASSSFRQLMTYASVFALAHCLTLGLASYKIVEVSAYWTEILITLSIIYSASVCLISRAHISQASEAFIQKTTGLSICLFGLIHGLGFAFSLAGMDLTPQQFFLNMGSFALGLELAQIFFLVCLWLILRALRKQAVQTTHLIEKGLIAATLTIAMGWLVHIS